MTFDELELIPKGQNMKIAKRIRAIAKAKAKDNNGKEGETPHGWGADPHQGAGGNNPRMPR
mgnify:CR=1 FL=1